ncbi:MAG: caspase family protein, partial [Lewinella sp.]|nr:caspase family protein [Lewinella sp.]
MPSPERTLHAVIIGINAYPQRPLSGCINDAVAVGEYFAKLCRSQPAAQGVIHWRPTYYLAPAGPEEEAGLAGKGIEYRAPTRANIVAAFDHFKAADPAKGDYCLFYYSGHGSFVNAPEVFADYEPSGEMQTIVCLDSREEGNRDLLDKELGYLIAKALDGKVPEDGPKVHFLSIMDCCHSGSNTRGDEPDIVARMESKGAGIDDFDKIEGFTRQGNIFYEAFRPGQEKIIPGTGIRHARYISLAAARDNELAKEKTMTYDTASNAEGLPLKRRVRHGVFTYSLLKTLEQSGANLSYAELMRRVEMEVRSLVDKQIPVLGKTNFTDDNQRFLRNEFVTPQPIFPIRFREQFLGDEWYMQAGSLHGILLGTEESPTLVNVTDGQGNTREVAVTEVRATESLLAPTAFSDTDKDDNLLSASIKQMASPKISVGLGHQLSVSMKEELLLAWASRKKNLRYLDLREEEDASVSFKVRIVRYRDEKEAFILTRSDSEIPLFIRHQNAHSFLQDVDKVGKWECTSQIANPATGIRREDFTVTVETLEDQAFGPDNFAEIVQKPWLAQPLIDPDIIHVRHVNDNQPAIKVKVTNQNHYRGFWIGALYLDSHFGITHEYLDIQEIGPHTQPSVQLGYLDEGKRYGAIPLWMDPLFHEYGITEIKDYLILFISKRPFDLSSYFQESIELNPKRNSGFINKVAEKEDDWFTIKIPIHIQYPLAQVPLNSGAACRISRTFHEGPYNRPIQSAAMVIKGPADFSAQVQATNLASARRLVEQLAASRSSQVNARGLLPSGSLWMGCEGSEGVFSRNLATSPDNHLSILELTRVQGGVSEDQPLRIEPGDPLSAEETIVPFGYDPSSDLYFPLGYTDEQGAVVIQQLPAETDGLIGAAGEQPQTDETGRSVGGSIKLFFQKVVWSKLSGRHDYHTLSWVKRVGPDTLELVPFQGTEEESDTLARQQISGALENSTGEVLLLIHGFTGDSRTMLRFVCQESDIHQRFAMVMAYDYENLDTQIEESAQALRTLLQQVNLSGQRLVIVGSSMGGLVARSLIEDIEGGAALVRRLIQVGTPNGGSELADLRQKLTGWITMGINGLTFVQPYLPLLSFVWRGIDKRL